MLSYAQNFEDVVLWRALSDISGGRYVDIGAQDPRVDSVSRSFYEAGWRGVHVEPSPGYADALRLDRPDEKVIEAVIGKTAGLRRFYEIADTGLSTGVAEVAEKHSLSGWNARAIDVPCITLKQLFSSFADEPIHWLKMDIEGMEAEALQSWEDHPARPWILVVESTYPGTKTPTHHQWIGEVLSRGYKEVYFDGLSRFFLNLDQFHRNAAFSYPPNVFDGFVVAQHHFSAGWSRNHEAQVLAELQVQADQAVAELNENLARAVEQAHVASAAAAGILAERDALKLEVENQTTSAAQQQAEIFEQLAREAMAHRQSIMEKSAEYAALQNKMLVAVQEISKQGTETERQLCEQNQQHIERLLQGFQNEFQLFRAEREAWQRRFDEQAERLAAGSLLWQARWEATNAEFATAKETMAAEKAGFEVALAEARANLRQLESVYGQRLAKAEWLLHQSLRKMTSRRYRWWRLPVSGNDASLKLRRELELFLIADGNPPLDESSLRSPASDHNNHIVSPDMRDLHQAPLAKSPGQLLSWRSILDLYDRHFVDAAYKLLLGRTLDPQGEGYYLGRLRAGYSKIHLLRQLRFSEEGRAHAADVPGLDREIQRFKKAQIPLIGWIWRRFYRLEGNSPGERYFRIIFNELGVFRNEQKSFDQRSFSSISAVESKLKDIEEKLSSFLEKVNSGNSIRAPNIDLHAHPSTSEVLPGVQDTSISFNKSHKNKMYHSAESLPKRAENLLNAINQASLG